MANSFTALLKQHYSVALQALLEENLVAMDLANTMLKSRLPDGNRVHYPRAQFTNVGEYTKYTDVTDQDITTSDEYLDIDKTPLISFVIDDVDDMENGWDIVSETLTNSFYRIKQDIEGNFFAEALNAAQSSASAITLSTSNVVDTFGSVRAELANIGAGMGLTACIDPFALNIIGQGALGNTYNVSDDAYKKGFRGEFQAMKIVEATNLYVTGSLGLATNPTADDTVTINGVTFTFVASPSSPGDVDIGGSAAASVDNLVAAINGGAGAGTAYIEVSSLNRTKLEGITAVDNTTSIEIQSKRGYKACSSNLTAAADKFGAFTINCPVMQKGAIHMVMQKEPGLKIQDVQKQLGTRYMLWARYGLKTFTEGAERMYNLKLVAQAAE